MIELSQLQQYEYLITLGATTLILVPISFGLYNGMDKLDKFLDNRRIKRYMERDMKERGHQTVFGSDKNGNVYFYREPLE